MRSLLPLLRSTVQVELINKFLERQQEQKSHQNDLMRLLVNMNERISRPSLEHVKPEMFDGESISPDSWLTFYEYACNENCWHSGEDKVKNMRLFLSGIAKTWCELRVNAHSNRP
uniref:Tick transposon n=1 Tax=Rhipicephalus appendiculatus TaxID=34631 RepID=A0A131Z3N7_RHIAP